jgi:4-hydroxy-tetrahydrodipicolinate synthase
LIKTAVALTRGTGVKVIAGTGTHNTAETVEISQWAEGAGVDGILVVTPYYNKPSPAGLISHFKAVADAVSCDLMLYNVPSRTGVSLTPQAVVELAGHPRIRALKEATGNVAFTSELLDALKTGGRSLDLLSGDDATFLPLLSIGAVGGVAMQKLADQGDFVEARALHQKFYPLFRDLFVESNPSPVKYALELVGFCRSGVRAPLAPLTPPSIEILKRSLNQCGVTAGSRL